MQPKWLEWAQKLQAMSNDKLLRIYAQIGLTYSEGPYDIERYKKYSISIVDYKLLTVISHQSSVISQNFKQHNLFFAIPQLVIFLKKDSS